MRDNLSEPDPDQPGRWVSFQAFVANLFERGTLGTSPTWAIWAQREAHERGVEVDVSLRAPYLLAAAQWILLYGQALYKQVLCPEDVSAVNSRLWKPGSLYHGGADLSLHRWHFWRDSFRAAAAGTEEKGFDSECQIWAARAADMMDALERNMAF